MDTAEEVSALSVEELARVYDRFVSARWRGEDEVADAFATWFEAHWTGQAPPEPDDPPQGASVLGGSGAGIRWYARDDIVLGYVTGRTGGCYRVATGEEIPSLTTPWDAVPAKPDGTDRLIAERVSAQMDRNAARAGHATGFHGGSREDDRVSRRGTLTRALIADRVMQQDAAGKSAAAPSRR